MLSIGFHQAFSYEDFIEGIKPKTDESKNVWYEIENGIFKNICELAETFWGLGERFMSAEGRLSENNSILQFSFVWVPEYENVFPQFVQHDQK
mgnify:CR=1 FL=1